ncbi:MAG: OmpA family protein [Mucilaginibacter polytrichastri]|nr:OmpA family protein [Mucilaginibacter polytrichastri]
MKKLFTLAGAMMISAGVYAQQTVPSEPANAASNDLKTDDIKPFAPENDYRTWSVGVHGGILAPWTIATGQRDFADPEIKIGYGAYVKKQITPGFGLQADFLRGQFSGMTAAQENGVSPYNSFKTDLNWSAALSANVTLANINWRHQQGLIQPYVTAGAGIMGYKATLTDPNGTVFDAHPREGGKNTNDIFIPVGIGLKFGVAPGLNIDLGYSMNFTNRDDLDGYNFGGRNDQFSYAHLGLEFALGPKSKPAMSHYNPVSSMRREYQGENQMLQQRVDAQNAQIASLNKKVDDLTADDDKDGVPNKFDKCPNTAPGTKVDGSGCPLPKSTTTRVYVTEEDKKVVKDAIDNLEFDFGKSSIRSTSFPSLDKVAQLLVDKNFSLKLAGHTDNVGSDAVNLRLSKSRAEAIRTYLISKGANASRIEATGYGKTQPIAPNTTEEGRQQNRRVEFTLY